MSTSAPAHRNALSPGTTLLWYRIDRVLGQGTFGITYLATDSNLRRPVAIKEYLPSQVSFREGDGSVLALTDDLTEEYGAGLRRFITEARTLAKFEHPNIVRVHNVFEAKRTAYLVMQYEDGADLGQILKLRTTLNEAEILHVLLPLLAGLEMMHAQGFVHRDIKPGNIFIRRDGTPVLLDFGSAREALTGEARTLTNFVSPGYAPIEQYASKSDQQGPWSDIYGLGATLYRAMTGRAPVDAVERSHALAHDTSDSYQSGAENAQGSYSEALLTAVDRALRFRAQERPQSIAEWRRELPQLSPVAAASVNLFATVAKAKQTGADLVAPTLMATLPSPESPGSRAAIKDAAELWPTPAAARDEGAAEVVLPAPRGLRYRHYVLGFVTLMVVALVAGGWLGRRLGEGGAGREAVTATVAPQPDELPATDSAPAYAIEEGLIAIAPAPAAAPPEVVDPAQQRLNRIADLLYGASQDLEALRLTSPPGANAYEKYHEILTLAPTHAAAARGIEAISDRYVGLVYRDLDAHQFARAQTYLTKAESLAPGRPAVLEARAALEAQRRAAATAQKGAGTATSSADPAPSRMEQFRQRFEEFAREQKSTQQRPEDSRGNQFKQRLGGGR